MPVWYSYGVGSVGFGPFREIALHVKTTNWVLEGTIENFPLMYHYRIMPAPDRKPEFGKKELGRYVRYWNGSRTLRRYMQERDRAKYQACHSSNTFPTPCVHGGIAIWI